MTDADDDRVLGSETEADAPSAVEVQAQELEAKPRLTLAVTETGVVVAGEPSDVRLYVDSLRTHKSLVEHPLTTGLANTAAAGTALTALAVSSADYVQLSQRSLDLLREHGALPGKTPGTFWGFVRNTDVNQFAGNLEFTNVSLAANQAAALQLAAATAALKAAIAQVEKAVQRVDGKVDGLVAHANAKVIGNVVAQHQVLTDIAEAIDRTGALAGTDWQTIAHLGHAVPAAITELRQTALLRIGQLDGNATSADRCRKLREVCENDEIGRALTLLVVAEDSYYQWQRIRLERARSEDPLLVHDMAQRANTQLARDIAEDRTLIDMLSTKLFEYATPRPLDRVHPIANRDLEEHAKALHDVLAEFAESRRVQVAGWKPLAQPTWDDAASEVRSIARTAKDQAIENGRVAGREIGSAAKFARANVQDAARGLREGLRERRRK